MDALTLFVIFDFYSNPFFVTNIIGIIPARYASTRFPGKPLVDIMGKSMIQRVYEQAKKSTTLSAVIVATDDERIRKHVAEFGGEVCMTSSDHPSGTDRCAEVISKMNLKCDAVVNIQGDEPFIEPAQIDLVSKCFDDKRTQLATLIKKVTSPEVLFNANSPKVIINAENFAIYFSRHPIPFLRGVEQSEWLNRHTYYQHIGIYGYSIDNYRHQHWKKRSRWNSYGGLKMVMRSKLLLPLLKQSLSIRQQIWKTSWRRCHKGKTKA
jgi:3-deoxy-manno-octulosonate cytidylyltransferase (CMP-KDO synthetase)